MHASVGPKEQALMRVSPFARACPRFVESFENSKLGDGAC
jgi:hypothetical protein